MAEPKQPKVHQSIHVKRALSAADAAFKRISYLWGLSPKETHSAEALGYDLALACIKWIADDPQIIEAVVFEALDTALRKLSSPWGVLKRDAKEEAEKTND